jgi:cellulose synthase (UDP-forming)
MLVSCALLLLVPTKVSAAELQTYTQQFQNTTTSLSGKSVETNTYFTKMDYWDVKKVTFNLNYAVTQLAADQISDITIAINGVKFFSFRPALTAGTQTEQIDVPLELVSGSNQLQVYGQILTNSGKDDYQVAQTPANWLSIYGGSNINFEYELKAPENTLKSFYDHFSGQDTVANQQSSIVTTDQANGDELTAAMIALAGEARMITTENDQIQVMQTSKKKMQAGDYVMQVALYKNLPAQLKAQISQADVDKQAVIQTYYVDNKHYLIVTAKEGKLLEKAARFVANAELMEETGKPTEFVKADTATYSSSLHDEGLYQLTAQTDKITGKGHHENSYFISLPNDRSNADGSAVTLDFRYSQNVDFERSLATVSVNGTTIGSKKLSAAKANGDKLTVNVPKGMSLGSSFTVQVAFDLEMTNTVNSDNSTTPWAEVDTSSQMNVKSARSNDLLFTNYPTLFIKNQTYDQIAAVIPAKLDADDFKSLTNVFNLIGSFARSNTGSIQFYTKQPRQTVLENQNLIVIGTPKTNPLIKKLNKNLYFQYSKDYSRFISNEKLSIEEDYGKQIGTAQLLRSPYNDKKGMLVLAGTDSKSTYLASTQINFQKNIQQYTGDAIVVDTDNAHYGYRFKKNQAIDSSLDKKQTFDKNSQLIVYLGIAGLVIILLAIAVFLVIRKQAKLKGGDLSD